VEDSLAEEAGAAATIKQPLHGEQLRSCLHALEHVRHDQVLHSRYEPCFTAQEYASRLRKPGVFGLDALHQSAQRVWQISCEPIELTLADPPGQAQGFTGDRILVLKA
jgi:hypothetical protein